MINKLFCFFRGIYRSVTRTANISGHDFVLDERVMGNEIISCVDCGTISKGYYGKRI